MRKLLLLAVIGPLASLAQEQRVMELSLKQAVEIALTPTGSARLNLVREAVALSEARSRQTLGALLPNVDGSLSYSNQTRNLRAFGINFAIPGLGVTPALVGPFSVLDARANATQTVFDFAALRRYQASRSAVSQARADDAATDLTMQRTARAYLALIGARATVEAAEANVTLGEALVELARSQRTAGTGTGIEITRQQVQLANQQQRLILARNEADRASLQLLREIGVALATTIRPVDPMAYQPVDLEPAEKALEAARASRADLRAQRSRKVTARMNYEAARYERLPSLSAFGDYGAIGPSWNDALPTRTAGFSLRIPVFDGGRRDARRTDALSQLRSEQIRTLDLEQQVELELRLAIDGVRASDAGVSAARESLSLAGNELEQARRRYEAGVTTSLEVTDAQTRLERARDGWVEALYSHNLARIDLEAARGTVARVVR